MFKRLLSKTKPRYVLAGLIVAFLLIWPRHLFDVPYSTVLTDVSGQLLSAHIADDGQWRFPRPDSVPHRFETCLLMFEDEYFYYHPGVNPVSSVRAVWQNIAAQRVVSGGSTITMQTIRLAKQYNRTLAAKLWETLLAVRLECRYTKKDILALYAAHAPFRW
jgi:penicillin-binding protein 1C